MKNCDFRSFGKAVTVVLVLAAAMVFAGCEQDVKAAAAAQRSYKNVASITNLNKRGIVDIPFDLNTAAVKPMQANQDIVWTVAADDDGTVGIKTEDIVDGKFTPAAAGELKLLATIQDGLGSGAPYTQDVSVTFRVWDEEYRSVTNIAGVRTAAPLGFANLVKEGKVYAEPDNDVHKATFTAIEWAVKDAGTTGAEIVNKNVLKTTAVGTVKVEAKVAWGHLIAADTPEEERDYRQEFDIEVLEEAPVYEGEDDGWDDENGNWDGIDYENLPPLVLKSGGVKVTSLTLDLDNNPNATLTATIEDETADVWWRSNTPDVVSVDNEGNVTAKGEGEAVIKATAKDHGQTAKFTVIVKIVRTTAGLYKNKDRTPEDLSGVGQATDDLLVKSFKWINANSEKGDAYIIMLGENISVSAGFKIGTGPSSSSTGNTANKNTNLTITLVGIPDNEKNENNPYSPTRTITQTANGALFTVYGSNAEDVPELVLDENITLVGKNSNNSALVVVGNTANTKMGKLTMKANSRITGNSYSNGGGGVTVAAGGTFIMKDGKIDNNSGGIVGGGVNVNANGTFTMDGGSITDNKASIGGAGVNVAGTFTMNGGSITGNETGGVRVFSNGTFTMNGGSITGNTTSDVQRVGNGTFSSKGGTVGVFIEG